MTARADVLIVGGGPSGAAAACRLAAAGRRVVLCEREAGIRTRVCGEFLSAGAGAELSDLGVPPAALGAARVDHVRLLHGRRPAASSLPFTAWGLAREVLDEALLARALARGAEVRRGVAVRRLQRVRGGWRALLADGIAIEAPVALLATGKHDLRDHQRPATRGQHIGFKMHWRLAGSEAAALAGHVELVWYEGGYAGLQPVGSGTANLCLAIRADAYGRLGRSWPRVLAHLRQVSPDLGARLEGARAAWARPPSVAGLPYGWLHSVESSDASLYRLGDQFAVIPSFTGEGMALALRTARLAAVAILAGEPANRYHRAARDEIARAMRNARAIEQLARRPLGRRAMVPLGRLPGVLPALARATRLRLVPAPPDLG